MYHFVEVDYGGSNPLFLAMATYTMRTSPLARIIVVR
jgi:hypothetical protein